MAEETPVDVRSVAPRDRHRQTRASGPVGSAECLPARADQSRAGAAGAGASIGRRRATSL